MDITPQQAIDLVAVNGRTREDAGEWLNDLQSSRDEGFIRLEAGVIEYDRVNETFTFDAGSFK